MSNSISAAKRRRAGNITSSPMFQSNATQGSTSASTSVASETPKPMSLQQVIGVFDRRLLKLEDYVMKQIKKVPNTDAKSHTNTDAASVNMDEIAIFVQNMMVEHFTEFNHRYEILAEEIVNLKHIVMKLQSYTLDVNKALIEERVQILSEVDSENTNSLRITGIDDTLHLRKDLENMMASTQEAQVEETQEAQVKESQEESQEAQVKESQEAQVKESQEAQVEESQEAQVEESQEAQVEESQEAQVEETQEAQVEETQEAQVEETQEVSSKKSKKQRLKKVVQATWNDEEISAEAQA
jgi:hypothetical protein